MLRIGFGDLIFVLRVAEKVPRDLRDSAVPQQEHPDASRDAFRVDPGALRYFSRGGSPGCRIGCIRVSPVLQDVREDPAGVVRAGHRVHVPRAVLADGPLRPGPAGECYRGPRWPYRGPLRATGLPSSLHHFHLRVHTRGLLLHVFRDQAHHPDPAAVPRVAEIAH